MDPSRFDDLTRRLGQLRSRRSVLGGLAGLAAGLGLGKAGAAKPACREADHPCEGNQVCCAGLVCIASGPGAAKRCTVCPPDQYAGSGNRCLCTSTGRPPGPNGCGCPQGQILCGGACLDPGSDVNNCGGCGTVCSVPAGGSALCRGGQCVGECPAGTHLCGAACVDDGDVAACGPNCEACQAPVNGAAVCAGGVCDFVCNAGFTRTGSTCCPTADACGEVCCNAAACSVCDPQQGACVAAADTVPCGTRGQCCGGACADTVSDEANCGVCGNVCPGADGRRCIGGRCCAADGLNCPAPGGSNGQTPSCCSGFCHRTTGQCCTPTCSGRACGDLDGCGHQCGFGRCPDGEFCDDGECVAD